MWVGSLIDKYSHFELMLMCCQDLDQLSVSLQRRGEIAVRRKIPRKKVKGERRVTLEWVGSWLVDIWLTA